MNNTISIPMIALRGLAVLPETVLHFDVSRTRSIEAVQEAMSGDEKIFLLTQKNIEAEEPMEEDLYRIGTIATIKQVIKMPKQILRVVVSGERRAEITELEHMDPYMRATVTLLEEEEVEFEDEVTSQAMVRTLTDMYTEFAMRNQYVSKEMVAQVREITDLKKAVNQVAANLPIDYRHLQEILEEMDFMKRYDKLTMRLANEVNIMEVKEDFHKKVKERIDKHQKEYVLREEMGIIREELGDDPIVSDAAEYKKRTDELIASDEVKEKLYKEIERFKHSMQSPQESGVIRTYIETMLEMPWDRVSEEFTDIKYAKELLDAEHYGLEKVKERVLEFLAVRALTSKGNTPILCLVGPPGTGKTSIGKSLAKALKKEYVRISLGGVRDEAEIRGHRKTYVGAMPGRIAVGMKNAGVKNPLFLLDEIDKVSTDYKGDTFSALLEVLDSEQNSKFRDHYLEIPLDLSEVTFVTTANSLDTIPRPLLDRMEIIEINSYTENEKVQIAMRHLIPKQMEKHGLEKGQLSIRKEAVWKIAQSYTREAGVRQLEREIATICRKAARDIYEYGRKTIKVTEKNLEKYLGKEKYHFDLVNEEDEVGIVRGLAWTSVGGDTLQIEVNIMPGKGELILTGQLGDVMKESAQAGISYIRAVGKQYDVADDFFEHHDIHVHIPEGAVPKDGPSAGITMATGMLSAIIGRKVRADIAMTGEITLRGRVLPIGGLKEKLLAAKNARMKTVLVPKKNEKDVAEISTEIKSGLEIILVSNMEEVLEQALCKM